MQSLCSRTELLHLAVALCNLRGRFFQPQVSALVVGRSCVEKVEFGEAAVGYGDMQVSARDGNLRDDHRGIQK